LDPLGKRQTFALGITLPGTNPQPGTAAGSRSSSRLDVVGWIRNTVAAVFMIEHRGSVALPQDLVKLSGKKRPDTSAQPETFFFSRSEWFLGVAKPALDKRSYDRNISTAPLTGYTDYPPLSKAYLIQESLLLQLNSLALSAKGWR